MATEYPFYLAGQWERSGRAPLTGHQPLRRFPGRPHVAGRRRRGRTRHRGRRRRGPGHAASCRRTSAPPILAKVVGHPAARRRDEIGRALAGEAGKPIRDALTEVDRAAMTFHVATEEARRIGGEVIPLDLAAHGKGRIAIVRRFPIGPVAAISPFNFPLNLSAHKLAPAVAAGNPIVLKPATKTPLSALFLASALDEAGLPKGALSVLPMSRELGDRLVTDDRFKLLTFTGSSSVGWAMKARAGKKKVILELGGNAGVIVDETADLAWAAKRVVTGGFAYAGQSCISVQRVFVHDRMYDAFAAAARRARQRAGRRRPARPGHRRRPDDRHGRSRSHRGVGEGSRGRRRARAGRRHAGQPRRSTRRRCSKARRKRRRSARRRSSRRWWRSTGSPTSTRRSPP